MSLGRIEAQRELIAQSAQSLTESHRPDRPTVQFDNLLQTAAEIDTNVRAMEDAIAEVRAL